MALAAFVYAPPVYHVLGQRPLTAAQWLPILVAPWALLGAEEVRKLFVRRRLTVNRRAGSPAGNGSIGRFGSAPPLGR